MALKIDVREPVSPRNSDDTYDRLQLNEKISLPFAALVHGLSSIILWLFITMVALGLYILLSGGAS